MRNCAVLRARRTRDSAARATASPRCGLQSADGKTAERESKKRPAPEATTEDKKAAAATQLLASNAAVTDADIDALLPDEGFQVLPPPKNDAQPKG